MKTSAKHHGLAVGP